MNKESMELSIRNCVFGFQCQKSWHDMDIVRASSNGLYGGEIRFCSGCEKEVYESLDDNELIVNIELNRCVVINRPTDSGIDQLMGNVKLPSPFSK
jgi:hypothetical protein